MPAIPIVGKCFPTVDGFLDYLDTVKFGAWRPRFVTTHHTGAPDLATWYAWQKRKVPVSDEQWMRNLASYYGNEMKWSSGPQFFFTPANYCVLTPPDRRGVHAVSFNGLSWGVEMVGDFDRERLEGPLRDRYVAGLAALHIATGLKVAPYQYATQGLHFHRDDPKTSKTCPGRSIDKAQLSVDVLSKIEELTGGEAPAEKIVVAPAPAAKVMTVKVPANDTLNVRAAASGKAPVVAVLKPGERVKVTGEAKNGETVWLKVDLPGDEDGWAAARYLAA